MGKTTWSGPVRTGRRNTPSSTTIGHIPAVQKVGVSGVLVAGTHTHTFASTLPACDITGIRVNVSHNFESSATAVVNFKIGTATLVSAFGTMLLKGVGVYDMGSIGSSGASIIEAAASAMTNWVGVAEGTGLVITVSAPTTAVASSRGVAYVTYYQTSAATV